MHQSTEQAKAVADKAQRDVSHMPLIVLVVADDMQHHAHETERESKLASLHAQSETGTGVAAAGHHNQTPTAPVAGAPIAGAGTGVGHQEAGYAQQPMAGQPIAGQPIAGQGVPQQNVGVQGQGLTGAQPTEGQQVAGAVRHM